MSSGDHSYVFLSGIYQCSQYEGLDNFNPREYLAMSEDIFVVTTGGICAWHLVGRARGNGKHPLSQSSPSPKDLSDSVSIMQRSVLHRCISRSRIAGLQGKNMLF